MSDLEYAKDVAWSLILQGFGHVRVRNAVSRECKENVELSTGEILRKNYVQQGDCTLDLGAAEIYRPTDAREHCKMGVMLCSLGVHGCPDRWGGLLMKMFTEFICKRSNSRCCVVVYASLTKEDLTCQQLSSRMLQEYGSHPTLKHIGCRIK